MRLDFYAAIWDRISVPLAKLNGARERIRRGAFRQALRPGRFTRLVVGHDTALTLCSTRNGLLLWEDAVGLRVSARLRDTAAARAAYEAVRAGKCSGASFLFATRHGRWGGDGFAPGRLVELVSVGRLKDVTICLGRQPAYLATRRFVQAA